MSEREFESLIDPFVARLKRAGLFVEPIDGAPWIDAVEPELPAPLPRSYGTLVRRYAFEPFEWGPAFVYGNSGDIVPHVFPAGSMWDWPMWEVTRRHGFIQFAQPYLYNYDAVCFDTKAPHRDGEYRIVQLDHEAILIDERIDIVTELAPSFVSLVEVMLASDSDPEPDDPVFPF